MRIQEKVIHQCLYGGNRRDVSRDVNQRQADPKQHLEKPCLGRSNKSSQHMPSL
jgi:hypothetical protein